MPATKTSLREPAVGIGKRAHFVGFHPILHHVFLWVLCVRFSMPVQVIFRFLDVTDSLCSLITSCGERCGLSLIVFGLRLGLPVLWGCDLMGAEAGTTNSYLCYHENLSGRSP